MSNDLRRIIEFIIEMDKLKAVLRKTEPVGLERYENSAEHSWQVCLLAVLLAQHARQPVDVVRVVEILLVHDIPEIDAGDQIVYQGPSEVRAAAERQAASRIFGLLPVSQTRWCMSRWEEYEARESEEAVFAYAVDRLMPVLQNLKNNGQSWRENKVPLEKVLAVNAAIGEALPSVWEQVQVLIGEFSAMGPCENQEKNVRQMDRAGVGAEATPTPLTQSVRSPGMPLAMSPDVLAHHDWLLTLAPLPAPGAFVDLGCGDGADVLALAGRSSHPQSRFVGVDASDKSIATAAARSSDSRVSFRQARLEGVLPFRDEEFDFVYSNDLLECLTDPTAFAREIARVLKPGGSAIIAHWDWDSQAYDGSDPAVVRRLVHGFADWKQAWMDHADGWMGRRLWGVFNRPGLFEGRVETRVLTNTTFAAPWYGHARAQDFRDLVKYGLATADDVERFTADQHALAKEGRYFYCITGYAFVGRRVAA